MLQGMNKAQSHCRQKQQRQQQQEEEQCRVVERGIAMHTNSQVQQHKQQCRAPGRRRRAQGEPDAAVAASYRQDFLAVLDGHARLGELEGTGSPGAGRGALVGGATEQGGEEGGGGALPSEPGKEHSALIWTTASKFQTAAA